MISKYNDAAAAMQVIGCIYKDPSYLDYEDKYVITEADFADYQQLEHSEPNNKVLRQNLLRDTYGNTYWYYYEYGL